MANKPIKRVIPAFTRPMVILNQLLPSESSYSQQSRYKDSLSPSVGWIFRLRYEDLCATHSATYIKLANEYENFEKASASLNVSVR